MTKKASVVILLISLGAGGTGYAADWPTFRHDAQRSGIAGESLPVPLVESWVYRSRFAPRPALGSGYPQPTNWEGGVEKRRTDFDRADSTVVAGRRVFFGSVGDGKVYCLDVDTGREQWTFHTGGPVRLAPTVDAGRVYVGSDDGWVYCLAAGDGRLVWKFHAAPDDHHVIGNGRLISLWPVRTGVLVDRGTAYFGAGFFPNEGVFIYAVDAGTGKLLWRNDRGGETRMAQISPQGYFLATGDRLVVPMARQAPGVYDRKTGAMEQRLSIYYGGGTFATLRDGCLFTGWEDAYCFRIDEQLPVGHGTSRSLARFPGGQLVVTGDSVYTCALPHSGGTSKAVKAFTWRIPDSRPTDKEKRRGAEEPAKPVERWTNPVEKAECVVLSGDTVFVGAPNRVVAMNRSGGETVWTAEVDGTAASMTVGAGRLIVSTDRGRIHCFGPEGIPVIGAGAPPVDQKPGIAPRYQAAAELIAKAAPDAQKGFAVVYGLETGELAIALARRTGLHVIGVTPDAEKAAAARARVDGAGLYGGRIVIREWPLDRLPTTRYFADLVVSESAIAAGKPVGSPAEMHRLAKPIRGKVVLGVPGRSGADQAAVETLKQWVAETPMAGAKIVDDDRGHWLVYTRPRLEGAGSWTHQYGPAGATGSSEDEQVRAPFRVQWFGDPGPEHMVDRHYWAAAPLADQGRMFVCSYKDVSAYDVYNGTKLWSYPLENATRAHLADVPGNVAVGPDGYFVAVEDLCYRLDPVTGKLLSTYKLPASADDDRRMWGYVACRDGVLIGSRTLGYLPMGKWRKSRGEQVAKWLLSDVLFAIDVQTGKILWEYKADWFRHNSIVLGDGAAFVSVPGATPELQRAALDETQPFVDAFPPREKAAAAKLREKPWVGNLISFDLRSGKANWSRAVDWSHCGGDRGTLVYKDGLLLQLSDVGGCKAFNGYAFETNIGRSVCVREAVSGDLVWFKPLNYRSRAVVVGDRIIAEPWAYDLATGDRIMVEHPVTGASVPWAFIRPEKHCGPFNASAHTLFFRNGGFGYLDLSKNEGVSRFESNRPSCWMSFISADGVALWPTGDSGCRCNLAFQCSVALIHDDESRVFADFTSPGALRPVKHLAVNLGAPGDRRDGRGRLWLAYPRAKYTSAIELPIQAEFYDGGGFERHDSTWNAIGGTSEPWVFTSSAAGIKRLQIGLRDEDSGAAAYTVKLSFAAPPGDTPGQRIFDIRVQNKTVRENVDIMKLSPAPDHAVVITCDEIRVEQDLIIDLDFKPTLPGVAHPPVLSGVEVAAE